MKRYAAVVLLLLSSCAMIRANAMQESQMALAKCLRDNNNEKSACVIEQAKYDSDKTIFEGTPQPNNLGGALFGIAGNSHNAVNAQNIQASPQPQEWMVNQGGRSYMCNNYGGSVNCN